MRVRRWCMEDTHEPTGSVPGQGHKYAQLHRCVHVCADPGHVAAHVYISCIHYTGAVSLYGSHKCTVHGCHRCHRCRTQFCVCMHQSYARAYWCAHMRKCGCMSEWVCVWACTGVHCMCVAGLILIAQVACMWGASVHLGLHLCVLVWLHTTGVGPCKLHGPAVHIPRSCSMRSPGLCVGHAIMWREMCSAYWA